MIKTVDDGYAELGFGHYFAVVHDPLGDAWTFPDAAPFSKLSPYHAAILTVLTLSPAVTAAYPWLFSLFGGFQSARTIHFFDSLVLVLFVLVHVIMVVRSGFAHQMRSMTLGRPSYGQHPHLTTDAVSDGR